MRVAYVTMAFPAGSEAFASTEVEALHRAGVDLTVYTMRPRVRDHARLMAERHPHGVALDLNSVAVSLRGALAGLRAPVVLAELVWWLVRRSWRQPAHLVRALILAPRALDIFAALRRRPPDVVHLFWGHYPALVGHLVQRHLPRVVVSMFLGAYDLVGRYAVSEPVARAADVVWTHAHENIPVVARLGVTPDRLAVVHRGLDLRRFGSRRIPKIPRRVTTAGRLLPTKGMTDVLTVFAGVLRAWPDASLTVLGEGPDRPRLEALAGSLGISGAVCFLGHVSHDRVADEVAAAEAFLYMSHTTSDRLPNVVKEAMASRCLCIVTETTAIRELVEDGANGFVVPRRDVAAAQRLLDRAFRDPGAAAALAARGSEAVAAGFDVTTSVQTYRERWVRLRAARETAPAATLRAALAPAWQEAGG